MCVFRQLQCVSLTEGLVPLRYLCGYFIPNFNCVFLMPCCCYFEPIMYHQSIKYCAHQFFCTSVTLKRRDIGKKSTKWNRSIFKRSMNLILAFLSYLASFQSYGSLKKLERAIHNWLMVPLPRVFRIFVKVVWMILRIKQTLWLWKVELTISCVPLLVSKSNGATRHVT